MSSDLKTTSNRPSRRTSRTAFSAESPAPDDPLLGFAPYVHKAPRRNSITPDRQRAFIATLAATGIVTQAARRIGASLEALYKLRHRPGAEGFSAAWEEAIDRGIARLEDCALERAILGEERPVVSQGKLVATYRRYDTQLMLYLLRQRRAQRWAADAGALARIGPGHPVYDRLRREWEAEEMEGEQDVLDSIDAMLDAMRQRSLTHDRDDADEDEARSGEGETP